jgi:hypothetical protein
VSDSVATRVQLVRDHLTLEIRPVRSLLSALMVLPWEATPGHPVLAAVQLLKPLYGQGARELPADSAIDLGKVWRPLLSGADREQAFRAFEVANLLALRRALRNGTVWIDHSVCFRQACGTPRIGYLGGSGPALRCPRVAW